MTPEDCAPFTATIAAIAADLGDLTVPDDLFLDDAFRALYEAPAPHIPCARHVIGATGTPALHRQVAMLAMQQAGTEGVIGLAQTAEAAHAQGRFDTATLETLLLPGAPWARTLADHARDPRAAAVFRYYAAQTDADPQRRDYVRTRLLGG